MAVSSQASEGQIMALDATASGVFPIAPTPFHPDGRLDEASIDTLIAGYLKAGSTGVTVLGIMGEAPKLELEESISIAGRFIKGFGKLPVIVGVSAPGFAAMRTLSRSVMEKGAAGVMIAPVPSLRTDDQVTAYYRQAIEAIGADIPFVIQDYPLTLSVQMTPKVIRQIVQDNPSCVMLKHEDWPGLDHTERQAACTSTAAAMAVAISFTEAIVAPISSMDPTDSLVASWIARICRKPLCPTWKLMRGLRLV
jgi:4-hydroxy-tetrahydrodipicolinate synthase